MARGVRADIVQGLSSPIGPLRSNAMFILPGLLGLIVLIYGRPFDFIPALRGLPLLYFAFAFAVIGFFVDVRRGLTPLRAAPHLKWVLGFYVWCILTAAVRGPDSLPTAGLTLTIAISIYLLIAHGLSSFKALEALAATILTCTLLISAICTHQGMQPFQCVALRATDDMSASGRPDGRACETAVTCYQEAPDPEASYRCEHAGLLGITSVGKGRVRYVGVLQDPNEASMAVAMGMPLAFAFYQRRRSATRLALAIVTFILATMTVVLSQSRGGQLVFLSVLGVYFLNRFKTKGLIIALVCALPVLALGGRDGEEAASSALERTENLMVGLTLFGRWPLYGCGFAQFTKHHNLTAHNSYLLAPSELGVIGMVVWDTIIILSIRTAWRSLKICKTAQAEVGRIWSLALLSIFAGMCVGVFFLSFNYHYVLWIHVGLSGALCGAMIRHNGNFKVDITLREVGRVFVGGLVFLAVLFLYTWVKLRNA